MTTATAAKVCVRCGRPHAKDTRMCCRCRTATRPYRACACGRMHRRDALTCFTCRNKNQLACRVCAGKGGVVNGICPRCQAVLGASSTFDAVRPVGDWPAGHFERLTERAAAGLPLFG